MKPPGNKPPDQPQQQGASEGRPVSRGTAGGVARAKKLNALAALEERRSDLKRRLDAIEAAIEELKRNPGD